jgi:hypothetical protein
MGSCETCKHQGKSEHEEPCKGCTHNATDNYEPITNADRIRSMSDEEVAGFLCEFDACYLCEHNDQTCGSKVCDEIGITERWLKSAVGCE